MPSHNCPRLSCRSVGAGDTFTRSIVFGVRASIIAPTASLLTTVAERRKSGL